MPQANESSRVPAPRRLVLGECDCFFLANEGAMKRSGQGIHLGLTVLELETEPDLGRVGQAMRRLVELHPPITYRVRLSAMPGRPPALAPSSNPAAEIPFRVWEEGDKFESLEALCDRLANLSEAEFNADGTTNLRCDLFRSGGGGAWMIFTWRHVVFDGFGAELLVTEAAALTDGDEGYVTVSTGPQNRAERAIGKRLFDHIRAARPVENFFLDLLGRYRFRAFSGPLPKPGRGRFRVETLPDQTSTEILERAGLISTPYFLACATRAVHRLWMRRGDAPDGYIMSVPIQLRKLGMKGPLFQNNISFMFFWADASLVGEVSKLSKVFQEQHLKFLRERLDKAFLHLLHLLRGAPPRFYSWYVRRRMKGEFTSFYHSNTGELAPDLKSFAGAEVSNAYHVPIVFNPPGVGLFLNQKRGKLSIVTTWRKGVISDEEQVYLTGEFLDAMRNG